MFWKKKKEKTVIPTETLDNDANRLVLIRAELEEIATKYKGHTFTECDFAYLDETLGHIIVRMRNEANRRNSQ